MECRGRGSFAHADDDHFREAALHGTGEARVELDAIEHEHAVGFVGMAIHPHVARRNGADLHHVHRRANRHAHRLFGDAERLDHRPLALGRAAVVGAHCGEQERPGAVIAQPVAGGSRDFGDVGDSAAAGRDADIALRHLQLQAVELCSYGGADIRDWIRDQFLMNAEKPHTFIIQLGMLPLPCRVSHALDVAARPSRVRAAATYVEPRRAAQRRKRSLQSPRSRRANLRLIPVGSTTAPAE